MIVAVDGPAGSGKSTACRLLAERLGFVYLDTGAMYRALAWALGEALAECGADGKACRDEDRIALVLQQIPLRFSINENRLQIFCGQRPLADELRSPEISEAASRISRMPAVREFMVQWQRKLGAQGPGIVAEGRDTATVVFPGADLKVFLTADLPTRARRRFTEYIDKGINMPLEQIRARIEERDEADSTRDHSPLRPAEGAVLVDTSHLEVEQVVDLLTRMARNTMSGACSAC